jgi:hypothetical protein
VLQRKINYIKIYQGDKDEKKIILLSLLSPIIIIISSCGKNFDLSTPEIVAKGFANALLNNNKEMAVKYFFTIEEARQIGVDDRKFREAINNNTKELDCFIEDLNRLGWKNFKSIELEKRNEGYELGHKIIQGRIYIYPPTTNSNDGFYCIKVELINLKKSFWKIGSSYR